MMNNNFNKLSDFADYSKAKIAVSDIDTKHYFSTENMLPNKGGVTEAAGLPTQDNVTKVLPGNVLVSNIRPYFKKIHYANELAGASNDVLCFVAKNGCLAHYLYYLLSSDSFFDYMMAGAKGTKMPRGDKGQIMNYPVWVPDHNEQQRIVSVLSALDKKIENISAINHNLEEQIRTLFETFCINNPQSFNWKQGTIADLGKVVGGSTPSKAKTEYYTADGIAWITPKDLSSNKAKFISKGELDITPLGFKNSSAVIMPRGTVLFSSRAPIGYISIAKNEVTTNQGFKSVIPHPHIGTAFVYCFLKHNLAKIESMASGSTFKEVSGGIMKSVPAIIPDAETLEHFSTVTQPLFEQQELLEMENQRLAQLRDALLPKLMSGEIDVSELEV